MHEGRYALPDAPIQDVIVCISCASTMPEAPMQWHLPLMMVCHPLPSGSAGAHRLEWHRSYACRQAMPGTLLLCRWCLAAHWHALTVAPQILLKLVHLGVRDIGPDRLLCIPI